MANIVELQTKRPTKVQRPSEPQRLNEQRVAEFEAVVDQILGFSKAA